MYSLAEVIESMATADVGSPLRVGKKRSFDAAFKPVDMMSSNYTWYVHFHTCKRIASAPNNAHAHMKLIIPALKYYPPLNSTCTIPRPEINSSRGYYSRKYGISSLLLCTLLLMLIEKQQKSTNCLIQTC